MIGVCIKYFHENYGGMLQAYATVSMLESRGIQYELIQYEKKRTLVGIVKSMPRLLNGVLLNDKYEAFLKKQGLKRHPEFAKNDAIRMKSFKKFKDEHFTKLSPIFKGYEVEQPGILQWSQEVISFGHQQDYPRIIIICNLYLTVSERFHMLPALA